MPSRRGVAKNWIPRIICWRMSRRWDGLILLNGEYLWPKDATLRVSFRPQPEPTPISHFVRFVRAKGCCEHCGRRHLHRTFHLSDARWWDSERRYWRDGRGRRVRRPVGDILHQGRWAPVALACAHLDYGPSIVAGGG